VNDLVITNARVVLRYRGPPGRRRPDFWRQSPRSAWDWRGRADVLDAKDAYSAWPGDIHPRGGWCHVTGRCGSLRDVNGLHASERPRFSQRYPPRKDMTLGARQFVMFPQRRGFRIWALMEALSHPVRRRSAAGYPMQFI
jgi:hypothetical protein